MSDDRPQAAEPKEPVVPLENDEELRFVEPETEVGATPHAEPAPLVEPTVQARPVDSVAPTTHVDTARPVDEVPTHATTTEPVVATEDPAAAEFVPVPAVAPVQTVYVEAPRPPRNRGNRGVGILIALAATVVFGALFAVAVALIRSARTGVFSFTFIGAQTFYVPVLFFVVGFILLVLLANRASWWAYILGSLFVGALVYFGTIGTLLLTNGVIMQTPDQAAAAYNGLLTDPYIITSALLAREVSLWMGAAVSARGRRIKQRNADAREAYERESAERDADFDNATGEVAR